MNIRMKNPLPEFIWEGNVYGPYETGDLADLPRPLAETLTSTGIAEEVGEYYVRKISKLAETYAPRHIITFYYSEQCPHCMKVRQVIREYISRHPEVGLVTVDAVTEKGKRLVKALGYNEVPLVTVDGTYTILGERNFKERLDYTIKLAEVATWQKRRVK